MTHPKIYRVLESKDCTLNSRAALTFKNIGYGELRRFILAGYFSGTFKACSIEVLTDDWLLTGYDALLADGGYMELSGSKGVYKIQVLNGVLSCKKINPLIWLFFGFDKWDRWWMLSGWGLRKASPRFSRTKMYGSVSPHAEIFYALLILLHVRFEVFYVVI